MVTKKDSGLRLRPFIMQGFFRLKNGPFWPLLFLASLFNSLYECRILCAALCKNKHFCFSYDKETTRTKDQGPGIYMTSSSPQQVPRSYCCTKIEKGDAVRIEPRPPSPSTCGLCARSSRMLFRPQASGGGTRMQGVLGESRASCRLSINSRAGSNSGSQQQQYEELVDNS